MKTTAGILWSVGLAVCLLGCGGGGGGAPDTLGEACNDVGSAFCERAIDCFPEGAPSQSECVSDFRAGCCGDDGTCGDAARDDITDDQWDACIDGFGNLTCPEVQEGTIPSECSVE
jgi:hypothetical protein